MIPFAGTDITENKRNEEISGKEFLTAVPSEASSRALDASGDEAMDMLFKKTKLPLGLRIIKWICAAISILSIGFIMTCVTATDKDLLPAEGLRGAWADFSWVFFAAAAAVILWATIAIIGRRKEKAVSESDESKNLMDRVSTITDVIFGELGVPADAVDVDVLSFTYKIKKGEAVPCERAFDTTPFTLYTYKAYTDGENLHLADADGRYTFPLSSLRRMRQINKRIAAFGWSKDDEPTKGEYKKYKMTVDEYGNVHLKPYYVLEAERDGESWGIYFPCYELDVFEKLTGIKAEE